MVVDYLKARDGAPAVRAFPFTNDWRRGCWVGRVTGPHPKFGFDREFLRGTPVKSRGTVEYSFADLGGAPAWIVSKDRVERRTIVAVDESGWVDYGPLLTFQVLEVFEAGAPGSEGSWAGRTCDAIYVDSETGDDATCGALVFPAADPCGDCVRRELAEVETASAKSAAPDEAPF